MSPLARWGVGARGRARSVGAACCVAAVAAVLVGAVAPSAAGAPGEGPHEGDVAVALGPDDLGSGLAWSSASAVPGDPGRVLLGPAVPVELAWDLTALDRSAYRSDLVRVEVLAVDGPGRLTVSTRGAHGARVVLFEGDGPGAVVLQVGRRAVHELGVDRPGRHVVELRASIPLAGGGTATGTASLEVGDGEAGAAHEGQERAAADHQGASAGGGPPADGAPTAGAGGRPAAHGRQAEEEDHQGPSVGITTELEDEDGGGSDDPGGGDPGGPGGERPGDGGGTGPGGSGPGSGGDAGGGGGSGPGGLAHTGADLLWALALALALLVLGAAGLVTRRHLNKNKNHS